jgi:hypothetical protein
MKLPKLLGYLTTNPQHAATAEALATQHGFDLEIVEPRELLRLEHEHADLVLDWDFLPEEYQKHLLNGTTVNIVAIHGYNLSDSLAAFLPRRGILCARRLDEQLFQALRGDADAA